MNPESTVSVIVPVLNEIRALPVNLTFLLRDPNIDQVIVVDGGSTDGSIEYVESLDNHRLLLAHSAPGRGRQMNLGARLATGNWLVFHHADSRLPSSGAAALQQLPATVLWGGFTHHFVPSNYKLRFISWLHNLRCRWSGVVYGDQSMFCRRQFFWQVGGFVEQPLEDLTFSDQALALSRSHLLPDRVSTDARKFRQIGEWRALAQVVCIVLRYQQEQRIGHEGFFRPYR